MSEQQSRQFDPKTFLSHVATLPGVYQMRDAEGKVLYVGKAKNLRNRLSSYFRDSGMSAKTRAYPYGNGSADSGEQSHQSASAEVQYSAA